MSDLIFAATIQTAVSLTALVAGRWLSRRSPQRRTVGLAVVALGAFLLYMFRYHGTWQIARLLPFSSAVVLGNGIPLGGAFFAGIALGQKPTPPWRRRCLAILILVASSYSVVCCFLGQLPARHGMLRNRTAFQQSRRSSCGACCAALLLHHHGIEASEEELLGLCLTSYRGCPALGLYRGLKLKTAGTKWDVEVVTCNVDGLLATEGPLLLRVRLPTVRKIEGLGEARTVGRHIEHAVLLTGARDANHLQIVDPAVPGDCRLHWSTDHLRECWCGEALRLVRRSPNSMIGS